MNAHPKSNIAKAGPCGCGGGTMSAPSQCSCGGGGCNLCQSQVFVRPNFFAGQLLTEEDLQLLSDYVVNKNRLHNRHMFGEGVVCGLDVACHPCGGGTVLVNAGYALDCCGNDITVTCAQELDINKMVRDLRRDMLGGYDCGDPCEDPAVPSASRAPVPSQASSFGAVSVTLPQAITPSPHSSTGAEQPLTRHYCLYLRYCEQLTDPVSPYATDEPCGFQTCEPTRVREGFRFELRCREPQKPHGDLISRICMCIGNLDSADMIASNSQPLQRFNEHASDAFTAIERSPMPSFGKIQIKKMTQARVAMDKGIAVLTPASSEGEFLMCLGSIRTVLRYPATLMSLDVTTRANLLKEHGEVFRDVITSFRAIKVSTTLRGFIDKISLPQDRAYANAIVSTAEEIGVELEKALQENAQPPQIDQAKYRVWAEGMVWSPNYHDVIVRASSDLREEFLDRLEKSPYMTDCALRHDVKMLSLNEGQGTSDFSSKIRKATSSFQGLLDAIKRYFLGCLCAAFNPPCPACNDMGVLLGCLEIKDCEVVKICNLERTFVMTAQSLRYWLSLGRLGGMIEDYCCPTPMRTLEGRVSRFAESKTLNSLNRGLKVPLKGTSSLFNPKLLVLSILEETCTQSEQDAVRLRKFLGMLFSDPRSSKVPQDLAAAFSVEEVRGTFDDPAISAALDEAVNARVKETLETLPLKADESVSAAVDTGLASAMAAPEFGKAIESVIHNAPTREMFAKAIDEQLNERLTRILKERQEFEEKINDQLGSLATGQKVSEIADEVEELRTVKRSHEKLLEKSTAMEKRLKKLEDKKTP